MNIGISTASFYPMLLEDGIGHPLYADEAALDTAGWRCS